MIRIAPTPKVSNVNAGSPSKVALPTARQTRPKNRNAALNLVGAPNVRPTAAALTKGSLAIVSSSEQTVTIHRPGTPEHRTKTTTGGLEKASIIRASGNSIRLGIEANTGGSFPQRWDLKMDRMPDGSYAGRERDGYRHIAATLAPNSDGTWKLNLRKTVECGRNATWGEMSAVVRK